MHWTLCLDDRNNTYIITFHGDHFPSLLNAHLEPHISCEHRVCERSKNCFFTRDCHPWKPLASTRARFRVCIDWHLRVAYDMCSMCIACEYFRLLTRIMWVHDRVFQLVLWWYCIYRCGYVIPVAKLSIMWSRWLHYRVLLCLAQNRGDKLQLWCKRQHVGQLLSFLSSPNSALLVLYIA